MTPLRAIELVLIDDRGQGLTEYAIILALVSVAAVTALGALSGGINTTLTQASSDV